MAIGMTIQRPFIRVGAKIFVLFVPNMANFGKEATTISTVAVVPSVEGGTRLPKTLYAKHKVYTKPNTIIQKRNIRGGTKKCA